MTASPSQLATLAVELRRKVTEGEDISPAAPWMLGALALRRVGGAQHDAPTHAVVALRLALCQTNTPLRLLNARSKVRIAADRPALEAAARAAMLEPLRAIIADRKRGTPERCDARAVLVAVAAYDERWDAVDTLTTAAPPDELAAVMAGLVDAASMFERGSLVATRAVSRIVQRLEALRAVLTERERDTLESELGRLGARHTLAVTPLATPAAALVERVLRGATGTRREIESQLHDALRSDPAQAALLPSVADAPVLAREAIARLHFTAIRARDDVAGAHALLDTIAQLGVHPSFMLSGMAQDPALDRWVGLVARFLASASPALRVNALRVLGRASHGGTELASYAEALLRCAIDRDRNGPKDVAMEARPVLEAAIASTKDRARFVDASGELLRDLDEAQSERLHAVLDAVLPEAIARKATPRAAPIRPEEEAAFLAAIEEAPDDDGPRLVYADALLATGDPRGELIVLQCERARTGARATERETALLRTHTRAWLGPVFVHLQIASIVFERGFLVAGALAGRGGLRTRWPGVAAPAWRTVERLDLDGALVDEGALLPPTVLPRLRSIKGLMHAVLRFLARDDLEHIAFRTFDPAIALPLLERQRGLRTLTVPDARLDPLVTSLGAALPTVTTLASPRRAFVRMDRTWALVNAG